MIGEDGLMNEEAGEGFAGLTTDEAQEAVLAALREQGLLRGEEPYTHSVPFSHRSGERIEPLISLQWFCRMDELAAPAIEVVETDKVKIAPDQWKRVYLDWMDNIRPWCVSRQLWWGHRIPVWYCDACEEVYVAESAPERCGACDGELRQEDDVLDTWFSSALWPFATLGWPDADSPELAAFYPTSFLTTARDILFLWVARMVMMGIEFAGDIPFDDVYVHSVIQAPDGRRMSKSLGTGIDPLDEIDRARRRRAALRPAGDVLEPGRALLHRQGRAGPRPRQQALERLAARPPERGRGRAGAPRGPRRGSLDPLAPRAHGRARRREPRRPTTSPTRCLSSTGSSGPSSATGTWRSSKPRLYDDEEEASAVLLLRARAGALAGAPVHARSSPRRSGATCPGRRAAARRRAVPRLRGRALRRGR